MNFSTILNTRSMRDLNNLCELQLENWSLLYKATRDGFSAGNFHRKCDNVDNTLTIVKVTSGNIFGGFTVKKWSSNNQFVSDSNAFIFSLINQENNPFKAKIKCSNKGQNAIYCSSKCGPVFGAVSEYTNDLVISSDSNKNTHSYSDFGNEYQHPDYPRKSTKARCILAGSHTFQTVEIEVYTKEFTSTILSNRLLHDLNRLCRIDLNKWALVYRASRDGFKASDFHSNCDGITNTLTVVKVTNGNIFGGYTEQAWHSNNGLVVDPNAYVFSLINKDRNPFRVMCSNRGKYAIGCYKYWGPLFGECEEDYASDFLIDSESNTCADSFSNFGCLYKHPDYEFRTEEADSILAGSEFFQTLELEVFCKVQNY